nr:hypothetical protein K-LCC10_0332 [Kaumoebavirus]
METVNWILYLCILALFEWIRIKRIIVPSWAMAAALGALGVAATYRLSVVFGGWDKIKW